MSENENKKPTELTEKDLEPVAGGVTDGGCIPDPPGTPPPPPPPEWN